MRCTALPPVLVVLGGVLFSLSAEQALWGQGIITTVAGSSKAFPLGGSPASSTTIAPVSAAVAPDGGVVFVDQSSHSVLKYSGGKLSPIAGSGVEGYSGDGGPATAAALDGPMGLAFDGNGALYIADSNNQRIRRVGTDGVITTVAGSGQRGFAGDGGAALNAQLAFPYDVAFDTNGNLYIADRGNFRIRVVSTDGTISTYAGSGSAKASGDGGPALAAGFGFPEYVAADRKGNVYIGDTAGSAIRKIDKSGTITTFAGTGQFGFSGDGGPAAKALITFPRGLTFDADGNLYFADSLAHVIRQVTPDGIVSTVAGIAQPSSTGDGGPAAKAGLANPSWVAADSNGNLNIADTDNRALRRMKAGGSISTIGGALDLADQGKAISPVLYAPSSVAVDRDGNVYIADKVNQRIRKVTKDGGIVTVAGTGQIGYSGDGGPATNATFAYPASVVLDNSGNLYVADTYNHRIRRVSSTGVITTFAGSGQFGDSGDGGAATSARLAYPSGVAVGGDGNVYISDSGNRVVRKVNRDGVISTVAGNRTAGFSGDGGPATAAAFSVLNGLALDHRGNLYIADTANNRVRRVDPGGTVATIAGNGQPFDFTGDGGSAVNAGVSSPVGLAVDGADNLYIADRQSHRVRRVSTDGIITTIAGTTLGGFNGDGQPATQAKLQFPEGVALDANDNVYIADRDNNRVREILTYAPTVSGSDSLSYVVDPAKPKQSLSLPITSSIPGLRFAVSSSDDWLEVESNSGTLPASMEVSVDASALAPGSYNSTITVKVPDANPPVLVIPVSVTVPAIQRPAKLGYDPSAISVRAQQGGSPMAESLVVANRGDGSLTFSAQPDPSASWLQARAVNSTATSSTTGLVQIIADPTGLAPGTYTSQVTVNSPTTSETLNVPVSMAVAAVAKPKLLLSQTGLTFRAITGYTDLAQCFAILNQGSAPLGNVTISTTAPWLTAERKNCPWPAVSGSSSVPEVVVNVDAKNLYPQDYDAQVIVTAPGADDSPQTVAIKLKVLASNQNLGPLLRPSGLVFLGASNNTPGSLDVNVLNFAGSRFDYNTGITTNDVGGAWLNRKPEGGTAATPPSPPAVLRVYVQPSGLESKNYYGTLTLNAGPLGSRTADVLFAVSPTGGTTNLAQSKQRRDNGGCTPDKLVLLFTQVPAGFIADAGSPFPIEVYAGDSCGAPLRSGSVLAKFTNGDNSIQLVALGDGRWAGTWRPAQVPNSGQVTVTVQATSPSEDLTGTKSVDGQIRY